MDLLEQRIHIIELYDIYHPLFTSKQKEYMEAYYFDNYSLTEISENYQVSRNAVHDLLKRTVQKLMDLEAKLHLLENDKKRSEIIEKIQKECTDKKVLKWIEALEKVSE